jgi:hypothetical protein
MPEILADPPVIRPPPPVIRVVPRPVIHLFRPPVIATESRNLNRLVLIFFRLARPRARRFTKGAQPTRAAAGAPLPRRRFVRHRGQRLGPLVPFGELRVVGAPTVVWETEIQIAKGVPTST